MRESVESVEGNAEANDGGAVTLAAYFGPSEIEKLAEGHTVFADCHPEGSVGFSRPEERGEIRRILRVPVSSCTACAYCGTETPRANRDHLGAVWCGCPDRFTATAGGEG